MSTYPLWEIHDDWKKNCRWVELSHPLSENTPHWSGFPAMSSTVLYDYAEGFYANRFDIVSQFGTHVDAPNHFVEGKPGLDFFSADQLVLPFCVVDVRDRVVKNVDYEVTPEDIKRWEANHGRIPEHAFVAIRTDWSKRDDMDNLDEEGFKHYPGWGIEAVKLLVEERNVQAIGHETSDTDAGYIAQTQGYTVEYYILEQERYQIELMTNLDQVPAAGALIICGFPRAVGASGFTARCIAVCPK